MAAAAYLVFGDEYLASAKAREIVGALVPEEDRSLGLEIIDGRAETGEAAVSAINACVEALHTMGFLGQPKVVWLRDASFLSEAGVGRTQLVKESVEGLARELGAGLVPSQVLLVSAPKVDKRYALYKTCKKAGEIHEFAIPDRPHVAARQAAETARAAFAKAGLEITDDALQLFVERVGADTRLIVNEVGKLSVYLGEEKTAACEDVKTMVSIAREVPAWDLADAFGDKDLPRALSILRQLLFQREVPVRLIATIEGRIRDLMIYREALDRRWLVRQGGRTAWADVPAEVADVFGNSLRNDPRKTHPYRAGILAGQAAGFSRRELARCQRAAAEAHEKLVSGSTPAEMVLEHLLIRCLRCRRAVVRERSGAHRP